jgi:DNA-binding MarR family transcriptional regulator
MACSPVSTLPKTDSADAPAPFRRLPARSGNCRDMAHWITIIQRVWSCGRQLRRWLGEQLAPWQLTDSEFLLLFSCSQASEQGLAQNDLSGALGMSPAQVSNLVEQLGRKELLRVTRPPLDRRRQMIQLSSRGVRLVETILGNLAPVAARLEPGAAPHDETQSAGPPPLPSILQQDAGEALVAGEAALRGLEHDYKAAG